MFDRLLSTRAPAATLLIRIMVGGVFLAEGLQKFLYPADLGSGRFAKIGISAPEFFGPFVGGFEIVCGALILLGLVTRFAAVPLLVIITVALFTTKVPQKHISVRYDPAKVRQDQLTEAIRKAGFTAVVA